MHGLTNLNILVDYIVFLHLWSLPRMARSGYDAGGEHCTHRACTVIVFPYSVMIIAYFEGIIVVEPLGNGKL